MQAGGRGGVMFAVYANKHTIPSELRGGNKRMLGRQSRPNHWPLHWQDPESAAHLEVSWHVLRTLNDSVSFAWGGGRLSWFSMTWRGQSEKDKWWHWEVTALKMLSKYWCLSLQTWAALSLRQRSFFLRWAAVNGQMHKRRVCGEEENGALGEMTQCYQFPAPTSHGSHIPAIQGCGGLTHSLASEGTFIHIA